MRFATLSLVLLLFALGVSANAQSVRNGVIGSPSFTEVSVTASSTSGLELSGIRIF